MKTFHKIIAIAILVFNVYFLYATIGIIRTSGGPMGWGLLALPFTVTVNLLMVPAVLSLQKRYEGSTLLLAINAIGFLVVVLIMGFLWVSLDIDHILYKRKGSAYQQPSLFIKEY